VRRVARFEGVALVVGQLHVEGGDGVGEVVGLG
jgi:hypothetical protein